MDCRNKSYYFDEATATEYLSGLSTAEFVLTVLALILTVVTVVASLRQILWINRYVSQDTRKRCLRWIVILFPIAAICSSVGVCMPRVIPTAKVFILLYLSRVMFTFVHYLRELFGGRNGMYEQLQSLGTKIVLATGPSVCCKKCLPTLEPTSKNIKLVEWLAQQVAISRPVLLFISLASMMELRNFGPKKNNVQIVTSYLNITSTVVCVWGLKILTDLSVEPLKNYCIKTTFIMVQLTVIFSNLQAAVFNILAVNQVIPCSSLLSSERRGEVWHHLLLIVEVFLISIATTYLLRPEVNAVFDKYPSHKTKVQIPEEKYTHPLPEEKQELTNMSEQQQESGLV